MIVLEYTTYDLAFSPGPEKGFLVRLMDNSTIVSEHSFELSLNELRFSDILKRLEEGAVMPASIETFHRDFGQELYQTVFGRELKGYFTKCLDDATQRGEGLRICLRFSPDTQEIAALPWEFLHDGEQFLVSNREILFSRLPAGIARKKSRPLESILRMLVVVSSPDDPSVTPLNTEYEQEVILEAVDKLQRDHKLEIDFTEDATFETIESYLNETDYHIVHFTGHGSYEKGRGYLILETEDGGARKVDNTAITDLLTGRDIRLVVLSACQSGKTSHREAYGDLASLLIKRHIPAVVAMQYSILDASATALAGTFYQALASNKTVDLALTEARITIKNMEKSNGIDFATPVLYLSDPDCIKVSEIRPEETEFTAKPELLADVQVMKKGFIGRKRELRLLQRDFTSDVKRAAIIHGFGGIGKTVLATRLALKMNRHFAGIFGMKCTSSTTPEDILNELNIFFILAGIRQFNEILYTPIPLKAKTAALVAMLNQVRFLIIFDNFEDCLNEERNDIADAELKKFIQQLLNTTVSSTKFIFTTRYNFDPVDGRLAGSIEHIPLSELPFPQTVWLMNNHRELADLPVKKKHEIFTRIGGHPWAIGLFALHAARETVDALLLELEPLQQEVIRFTLLDKSYSGLDEKARALLLHASIYQEAVPVEALKWITGSESQPSPPVGEALSTLIDWGLMATQEERDITLYILHTLVREFAEREAKKENLDRKQLLVRAARYYEHLSEETGNIWNILKAREYYFQAEEWEKAYQIIDATFQHLIRWGYIELGMKLLHQSINTTSGTSQAYSRFELANLHYRLGNIQTALDIYNGINDLFQELGDKSGISATLHQLGMIHQDQGNYEEAVKHYRQSLKIKEELGNKSGIAITLGQLGRVYEERDKDYPEALEKYLMAFSIFTELHSPNAEIVRSSIGRLKEKMGDEAFQKVLDGFGGVESV